MTQIQLALVVIGLVIVLLLVFFRVDVSLRGQYQFGYDTGYYQCYKDYREGTITHCSNDQLAARYWVECQMQNCTDQKPVPKCGNE